MNIRLSWVQLASLITVAGALGACAEADTDLDGAFEIPTPPPAPSVEAPDPAATAAPTAVPIDDGPMDTLITLEDPPTVMTAMPEMPPPEDCEPNFTGIVRDFQWQHPDFEQFHGEEISPGIVMDELGEDKKPVYNLGGPNMMDQLGEVVYYGPNGTPQTTSQANFDQWYRDTPEVNIPIEFELPFEKNDNGLVFHSEGFFPIDDQGFGNQNEPHNFSFTFELHMRFTYFGGEVFTFIGDDDLWVFINNKLAVDVGGLHPPMEQTIDLDAEAARLGITAGETYDLDLFHAERHTYGSTFHVETSIVFVNCDPIFVPPPKPAK